MPTLWQILTGKVEKPIALEDKFYNPLGLKINSPVKIDTIDTNSLNFSVQSVIEIKSELSLVGEYDLIARPIGSDPIKKRIRLVRRPNPESELKYNVLLLDIVEEFEFDQAFNDDMENNAGELYWPNPTTGTDDQFWRVDDVKLPWKAKTAHLSDKDVSGKVDEDEVQHGAVTTWDFWRETTKDDRTVLEFVIINRDENGWFQIWRGQEIDSNRIMI